ncbi:MAG: YdbL family protein [Desulfobacterales bacterium]
MKVRTLMKIVTLLSLAMLVAGLAAHADDIKARMKKRLPVIVELKNKGIVGENNKGYLEFIGNQKAKADVVAAENKDRRTVYEAIAKQQGTTAELVGKRRALQIANKANKGEWVQDAGGQWQQK